jgi:adenine-specific DNA-methyltransferase
VETTTEGKKYPFNNAGNGLTTLTFPAGSVKFNMPDGVVQPQDMSEGAIITRLLDTVHISNGRNSNSFRLEGEWRFSQTKLNEIVANSEEIIISKIPFRPNHVKKGGEVKKMKNVLSPVHYQMETNEDATQQLVDLFGVALFDNPKPVKLLKYLIRAVTYDTSDAVILDFFSGSATTADAVMQLNAEDGGNRKFIMVQLPETTDEKSEAYKAGYMNICEIGKERIRRAGEKIKEEKGLEAMNLDVGFKVLKLDTSNIRKWQPDYNDLEQSLMDYIDNYVEGRTELDVVYEIMIKYGLDLTYPVDEFTIAQKKVYSIGFGMLMICLDDEITTEVAKGILVKIKELSPESSRVVFKDNGFKSDSNKTNIKEILKSGGIEEFITI